MTSRSKHILQRTNRVTQKKMQNLKTSVVQEESEHLKKSEVFVNDFTESVHELTTNKLKSEEKLYLCRY
jgi:hypothetical protein